MAMTNKKALVSRRGPQTLKFTRNKRLGLIIDPIRSSNRHSSVCFSKLLGSEHVDSVTSLIEMHPSLAKQVISHLPFMFNI